MAFAPQPGGRISSAEGSRERGRFMGFRPDERSLSQIIPIIYMRGSYISIFGGFPSSSADAGFSLSLYLNVMHAAYGYA